MSPRMVACVSVCSVAIASLVTPPVRAEDSKSHSLTVPLEPKLIPLEVTVEPMVFHSVSLVIGPPKNDLVTVTVIVKASNPGSHDEDAVVKVTVFAADGTPMTSETKRKEIEEGENRKDIKVEVKLQQGAVSPQLKCKVDLSVS